MTVGDENVRSIFFQVFIDEYTLKNCGFSAYVITP
jgi:hypothetical protein